MSKARTKEEFAQRLELAPNKLSKSVSKENGKNTELDIGKNAPSDKKTKKSGALKSRVIHSKSRVIHSMTDDGQTIKLKSNNDGDRTQDKQNQKKILPVSSSLPAMPVNIISLATSCQDSNETLSHVQPSNKNIVVVPQNQRQQSQQSIVLGQTVFQSNDGKKFILMPSSSDSKKLPLQPMPKNAVIDSSPKGVFPVGSTFQSTPQTNISSKGYVYMPTTVHSAEPNGLNNPTTVASPSVTRQALQNVPVSSINTVSQASLIKIEPGYSNSNSNTAQVIQLPLNVVQASNILTNMARGPSSNVIVTGNGTSTSGMITQCELPSKLKVPNSLTTAFDIALASDNKLTIKDIVQAITDKTDNATLPVTTSVITSNFSYIARSLFPNTASSSAASLTQPEINAAEALANGVKVASVAPSVPSEAASSYLLSSDNGGQHEESVIDRNAPSPCTATTTVSQNRPSDNSVHFLKMLDPDNSLKAPPSTNATTLPTSANIHSSTFMSSSSKGVNESSTSLLSPTTRSYNLRSQPNPAILFPQKIAENSAFMKSDSSNPSYMVGLSSLHAAQVLKSSFDKTGVKEKQFMQNNGRSAAPSKLENPVTSINALSAILGLVNGTGVSSSKDQMIELKISKSNKSLNSAASIISSVAITNSELSHSQSKSVILSQTKATVSDTLDTSYQTSSSPSYDKKSKAVNGFSIVERQKDKKGKKKIKRSSKVLPGDKANHPRRLGPPFSPNREPPLPFTPASATCTLFEHTLLKIATRGFWGCEMGVLQDVFRTIRCEPNQTVSLDYTDTVEDVTHRCYEYVKQKLLDCSDQKEKLHKYMRNYVREFDSYLERVYPVAVIALIIYLPNASDYIQMCWHGVPPTGWSEYRRAVVMREVFEVLVKFGNEDGTYPEYDKKFFESKIRTASLKERTFDLRQRWDEPECLIKKSGKLISADTCITQETKDLDHKHDDNENDHGEHVKTSCVDAIRSLGTPASVFIKNDERFECCSVPLSDSKCRSESSAKLEDQDSQFQDSSERKETVFNDENKSTPGNEMNCNDIIIQPRKISSHLPVNNNISSNDEETDTDGDLRIVLSENEDLKSPPKRSRNFQLQNFAELVLRDSGRYNEDSESTSPEVPYSKPTAPTSLKSHKEFFSENVQRPQLSIDTSGNHSSANSGSPRVLSPSVISAQWAESIAAACGNQKVWKKEQSSEIKEMSATSTSNNVDDRLSFLVEAACQQASVASSNESLNQVEHFENQHFSQSLNGDDHDSTESTLPDIKRSVAFEALWTDRAPDKPYVTLHDGTNLAFGEYFERYPLETYCPSGKTVLVVEGKNYKLKDVLGYLRRGVQLVEYIGSNPVVDTTRTIKKDALVVAVRKVPPGKISKMIHPELHLENYSLHLLPIGIKQPQKAKKSKTNKRKRKIDEITEESETDVKEVEENLSMGSPPAHGEEMLSPASRVGESEESCLSPLSKQRRTNMPFFEFQELGQVIVNTQGTQTEDLLTGVADRSSLNTSNVCSIEDSISTAIHSAISQQLIEERNGNGTRLDALIDSYKRAAKFLLETAKCLENIRH